MHGQTMNNDVTLAGGENPLLAGRYHVVRQLGTGGMGSVWLAEDRQLDNKPFAVKMLPSILVSNKRAYRQLKDEALVAMKLVHPNIVQIRAFEENDGNPFLVMDYIEGQTLDDYLAEHTGTTEVLSVVGSGGRGATALPLANEPGAQSIGGGTRPACPPGGIGRAGAPRPPQGGLPESEVIRILKPIAAALDYAHAKGVVHRDVKPGNVMIAKDGTPYILDFGIAREIQETMTRVTGKLSSGTLLYMSPEQLRGQPPEAAQDVYSFAAMAYECLKGEPPFSRGQIEYQILNEKPAPLPDGMRMSASIMRGLSKMPENRPETCDLVLIVNQENYHSNTHLTPNGSVITAPVSIRAEEAAKEGALAEKARGYATIEDKQCVQDKKWPSPKTVFVYAFGAVVAIVGFAGLIVLMIGIIDGWDRVGYVLDLMFRR